MSRDADNNVEGSVRENVIVAGQNVPYLSLPTSIMDDYKKRIIVFAFVGQILFKKW